MKLVGEGFRDLFAELRLEVVEIDEWLQLVMADASNRDSLQRLTELVHPTRRPLQPRAGLGRELHEALIAINQQIEPLFFLLQWLQRDRPEARHKVEDFRRAARLLALKLGAIRRMLGAPR